MQVNYQQTDGQLTATIQGRLGTAESEQFMNDMQPLMEAAGGTILLDCHHLEYISSYSAFIFSISENDIGVAINKAVNSLYRIKNFRSNNNDKKDISQSDDASIQDKELKSVTEALAQGEKDGKKAKLIFMDSFSIV